MCLLRGRCETGERAELLQPLQEDIVRQVDAQGRNTNVSVGYGGHISSFLRYGRDISPYPVDGGPKLVHTGGDTMRVAACLLYTSDAADDLLCVDLGGRRIIKKKKKTKKTKTK